MERQTRENTFKNITLTIYNCVYSTGILISPVCLKFNYGNSLKKKQKADGNYKLNILTQHMELFLFSLPVSSINIAFFFEER